MSTILVELPARFWIYAMILGFVVGLMTGAAQLPWWGGAIASVVTSAAALVVIVALVWLRRTA